MSGFKKNTMQINKLNSVNFGAKFLTNTEISKYNPKKKTYQPLNVSLVEIEPASNDDLRTLVNVAKGWGKNHTYATDIASTASGIAGDFLPAENFKIYALTRQDENYEKLNEHKILGLAQIELEKHQPAELAYLQVNPETAYASDTRQYKQIGTGFINVLKKIYNKAITLSSVYSATNFYEKNGFELIDPNKLRYIWRPGK